MEQVLPSEKKSNNNLAIEELNFLNTEQEDSYDNITKLASFICETPISLITFFDGEKQYFKSKIGTELTEADREVSHCAHAILNPEELMEVPDTREDPRFASNPYTIANPPILFYAGMPIKAANGVALGTLCVLDTKAKILSRDQKEALIALARQVENLFELRRQNLRMNVVKEELKNRNNQLKDFAGTVSHDMKMPLANIIITADLLKAKYAEVFDKQGVKYLDYLKKSSFKLSNYINGILQHYESDTLTDSVTEEFDIHDLLEQIIDLLNINYDCVINLPEENNIIKCHRSALEQIFMNLLGNSLKYNSREEIIIDVKCTEDHQFYYFTVTDNGIGIPKDKQEDIFELFTVLAESDRSGNRGNGIGLSTVKKLITSLGGEISVKSQINKGTTVHFSISKNSGV